MSSSISNSQSRSKQEDPEQLKLKERAKAMHAMELEQMRQKEANLTALAAIGSRKKRKVDSPTPGSVPGGPGQVSKDKYNRVYWGPEHVAIDLV